MAAIDISELKSRMAQTQPPLLLHVLPEEVFAARRIAGSCNACIYETAFIGKVAELAPDKERDIIVYGAGGESRDVDTAVQKLIAAGYTHVQALAGTFESWQTDGAVIEGDEALPQAPRLDGTFRVDTAASVIRWTGRNLFNHHNGTLRIAEGEIVLKDNSLVSARIVMDMNSLACEDLTDAGWNAMLIRHLHDADFFEVTKYPVATMVIDRAESIGGCTEGSPNYLLHGTATVRGVSQPLSFPAVIASEDGARLTGQGQFELDRTAFGSVYGSGKFFRFLGKHVVNDLVHLHVKLHADKVAAQA